jgi:hypothetical protein
MATHGARRFLIAAVICGGILAACDDSAKPADTAATSTNPTQKTPKVAGLAPDMVAAVSAGKTAAVISVHFALGSPPTVNEALPVEIAIVPHRDFTAVRAQFETHDGLTLTTGGVFGPRADAPAETALKHRLVLLPGKEGVFMVTAIVETEGQEGTVTRVFSIPVIVAAAPGTPPANPAPAKEPPAPAAN